MAWTLLDERKQASYHLQWRRLHEASTKYNGGKANCLMALWPSGTYLFNVLFRAHVLNATHHLPHLPHVDASVSRYSIRRLISRQ